MKRTAYAEEHGEWVYDWHAILWNIEHGLCTGDELREWRNASSDWVTCACGNQCAAIPRYGEGGYYTKGAPRDAQLRGLGAKFCERIWLPTNASTTSERATYCAEARDILGAIEKRAAEVLKEMGK